MVRRRVARGLLLVGACVAAGGSAASPAVGANAEISPAGVNADSPRVALDAAGDAFAVWKLETASESYVIEVAERPDGGAWQAPVVVSEAGKSANYPAIAVDGHGDAIVVWQGEGAGNEVIGAAFHPAGGGWEAPESISAVVAGETVSEPAVAISAAGEATVVWQSSDETKSVIEARSRPLSGPWEKSGPVTISSSGDETDPAIAVNAGGGAAAAWVSYHGDISGAARRVGSKWSDPSGVPYTEWQPSGPNVPPHIGLDSSGDAIAVWAADHNEETEIRSAVLQAGKGWKSSTVLATGAGQAAADSLLVSEAGEATALWTIGAPGSEVLQLATMPAQGSWGSATGLTGSERDLNDAVLAANAAGSELVDWDSSDGETPVVHTRTRPAGAGWDGTLNLSGTSESASIGGAVLDGAGNAIQVYRHEAGPSTRTIQAIEYPITGVLLGPPSIPASGTAGVPVSLSIGPADELTGLGAVNWSFGDGSGAEGAAVSHTYAAAGSYTVSVTGLDAFANPFGASGTITIAPRAPVLGALKQSASSWREGTRLASLASRHKPAIGTTFSFSLNEAATLSFAFTTKGSGRRGKGRCVAQSHRNLHARRCTRAILRGKLQLTGRAGADAVRFQGLLSKHAKLKPGTYTLTVTASASGLRSASRSVSFRILG